MLFGFWRRLIGGFFSDAKSFLKFIVFLIVNGRFLVGFVGDNLGTTRSPLLEKVTDGIQRIREEVLLKFRNRAVRARLGLQPRC
jgi:hypothetical protein